MGLCGIHEFHLISKVYVQTGYVAKLFDAIRERRQQLPSFRVALRDLRPVLEAMPKPLTSQHTKEDKEVVVARHRSRFNKD